jgi:hypothetical protein
MSRASRWRTSGTGRREHRRLAGRPRGRQSASGAAGGCANAWKVGKSYQHKRAVPVPADETAHFVVVQTQIFSVFKLFLNMPPASNGLDHFRQGGSLRGKDEVVRFLVRSSKLTTKKQPMALILFPAMQERDDRQRHQSLGPLVPSLIARRCHCWSASTSVSTSRTSTLLRCPSGVRIPTGSSQATART